MGLGFGSFLLEKRKHWFGGHLCTVSDLFCGYKLKKVYLPNPSGCLMGSGTLRSCGLLRRGPGHPDFGQERDFALFAAFRPNPLRRAVAQQVRLLRFSEVSWEFLLTPNTRVLATTCRVPMIGDHG